MTRETDVVARYSAATNEGAERPPQGFVEKLADEYSCSREAIYIILRRAGISRYKTREERAAREPRQQRTRKRRELRPTVTGVARFTGYKADPKHTSSLSVSHPAVVQGHTLFPGNVVDWMSSPRFLVSGHNNSKTGKAVLKGEWAGFPIYTLTLEERATCPRSCLQWRACYGNSMHWPRRNDASHPDFIAALAAEVITVARLHPAGFVVRLHVLGDFYSVPYVKAWGHLLAMLPNLRVWGYTARRTDDPDAESAAIAREIDKLRTDWSRFAIRTSHGEAGPARAIVVDQDPKRPDIIVCPAQTDSTAACMTCGLCWAPSARGKTIAFIRHGIKTTRGGTHE